MSSEERRYRYNHPILSTRHAFAVERLRNDERQEVPLSLSTTPVEASLKEALLIGIQYLSATEQSEEVLRRQES